MTFPAREYLHGLAMPPSPRINRQFRSLPRLAKVATGTVAVGARLHSSSGCELERTENIWTRAMKCETCHGQGVAPDGRPWSEAMSVTTMGVCIRCHAANNGPNRLPKLAMRGPASGS